METRLNLWGKQKQTVLSQFTRHNVLPILRGAARTFLLVIVLIFGGIGDCPNAPQWVMLLCCYASISSAGSVATALWFDNIVGSFWNCIVHLGETHSFATCGGVLRGAKRKTLRVSCGGLEELIRDEWFRRLIQGKRWESPPTVGVFIAEPMALHNPVIMN